MPSAKELHFFEAEENWNKGQAWYASHFKSVKNHHKIYGETTPAYSRFPVFKGVAQRIYDLIPNAKLIYLVRDPIERIIAHYQMEVAKQRETRTINEVLTDLDDNSYIIPSCYALQLEQYLAYFPMEQILIVSQSALYNQRRSTLQKVFEFLGVNSSFYGWRYRRKINPATNNRYKTKAGMWLDQQALTQMLYKLPPKLSHMSLQALFYPFSRPVEKPSIDAPLREKLSAYLKDDVNRFRQLTQEEFSDWSL